jgi:hypothetical protein
MCEIVLLIGIVGILLEAFDNDEGYLPQLTWNFDANRKGPPPNADNQQILELYVSFTLLPNIEVIINKIAASAVIF